MAHTPIGKVTRRDFLRTSSLIVLAPTLPAFLVSSASAVGPDETHWPATVDKALQYLRTARAVDGSYSKELSLGVTGVVVTGILQTGRISPEDPFVDTSLKYLESLIHPTEGHIAGKNPANQLKNYVTAVNLMAFSAADRLLVAAGKKPRYENLLKNGARYLTDLQWDEGEGKPPTDNFYGGIGYDSKGRPDVSNTSMAVDALKGVLPANDPVFKKIAVFVSRNQNRKGEYNDQPWAKIINDGGFIYTCAGGGETKADVRPDGGLTSYGSMTYAGVKSLIYAGVKKDDPRIKDAVLWIQKHYTLEENPGMPKSRNQQGLYYYYHVMAKCLDALAMDELIDATGVKHDWRKELTEALAKRQRPDGSWANEGEPRWMEGDPNLATGFALMALSYCKPTK